MIREYPASGAKYQPLWEHVSMVRMSYIAVQHNAPKSYFQTGMEFVTLLTSGQIFSLWDEGITSVKTGNHVSIQMLAATS